MSQEAIFQKVQQNFLLPENYFDDQLIESNVDATLESLTWSSGGLLDNLSEVIEISLPAKPKRRDFRHYVGSVAYRIKQMLTDLSYSVDSQKEFQELMQSSDLALTRMFIVREYKKDPKEFCDSLETMGLMVANCNVTSTLIIVVVDRSLVLNYGNEQDRNLNAARPQRNP